MSISCFLVIELSFDLETHTKGTSVGHQAGFKISFPQKFRKRPNKKCSNIHYSTIALSNNSERSTYLQIDGPANIQFSSIIPASVLHTTVDQFDDYLYCEKNCPILYLFAQISNRGIFPGPRLSEYLSKSSQYQSLHQ